MTNYPAWYREVLSFDSLYLNDMGKMSAVKKLAIRNVEMGGGPFAAAIFSADGQAMGVGANAVIANCDSTAHAEILAIRAAQRTLQTHNLSTHSKAPFSLFSSCTPCIMCFGAIWWSGLHQIFCSATKEDAEACGFSEGPVSKHMWEALAAEKGVQITFQFLHDSETLLAFEKFKKIGVIY